MKKLDVLKTELKKYESTVHRYKQLFEADGSITSSDLEQLDRLELLLNKMNVALQSKRQNTLREDQRVCYIFSVVDSNLRPITLSDKTIVGYKADRVIQKIQVNCEGTAQSQYSIYEQNKGVLKVSERPRLMTATGDLPATSKRPCDFEEAKQYFNKNINQTTFTPAPLIWHANTESIGSEKKATEKDNEEKAIEFVAGGTAFKNPVAARAAILSILKGVAPNGLTNTAWIDLSTSTENDSEGNSLNVLLQTKTQTEVRTIVRITIYTTLSTPSAVNSLGITNAAFMDQRLLKIGRVLVGQNKLTNNDVRRGKRDSANGGIVWKASSQQREGNANYVSLDRVTTTTTRTMTQQIITPTKPIEECP